MEFKPQVLEFDRTRRTTVKVTAPDSPHSPCDVRSVLEWVNEWLAHDTVCPEVAIEVATTVTHVTRTKFRRDKAED